MCGKIIGDETRKEDIKYIVEIAPIVKKNVEIRLKWFGIEERKYVSFIVKKVDQMKNSQINRGI